jgi:triosephosphate isomerase
MRRRIVAANWKMNTTLQEATFITKKIIESIKDLDKVDVVICPPFVYIYSISQLLRGTKISLGAQNVHWEIKGAYTGEISPCMLKDVGCKYVIIGHSERRKYFNETDEMINNKIKSAIKNDLIVIFCIGETLEERKNNMTYKVIEAQMKYGLKDISQNDMEKIIIAYEPVWAIGTGVNATKEQIYEAHKFIRKEIEKNFSLELASKIKIQYGGSVNEKNIEELALIEEVDGFLVGGASLNPATFIEIIKKCEG